MLSNLPNLDQAVTIYKLPDSIRDQLDDWQKLGKPPSELIASILCNSLFPTMMQMNKFVGKHLEETMQYINQELNPECWGSSEKMKAWFMWKKGEEKDALSVVQMREGIEVKRQVRALQEALNLSNAVVEEILKAQKDNPHKNLSDIHQKAIFALEGAYEASLALKVG